MFPTSTLTITRSLRTRAARWYQLRATRLDQFSTSRHTSSCAFVLALQRNPARSFNNFRPKRFLASERKDPFARRPNQICDPYGQGGKPLSLEESNQLMYMVENDWQLEIASGDANGVRDGDGDDNDASPPKALLRTYHHRDYMGASAFISKIAAVGDLNNHYPTISLERKLLSLEKRWEVTTTLRCHTVTLGGLSRNDFHIAMLVDVETARPEVNQYLV